MQLRRPAVRTVLLCLRKTKRRMTEEQRREDQGMTISIAREQGKEDVRIGRNTPGETLLSVLQREKIYVDAPCSGKGSCGRCRIQFVEGAPVPTGQEKRLLTEEELTDGIRLACCARPDCDCRVRILDGGMEHMTVLAETGGTKCSSSPDKGTAAAKSAKQEGAGYGIAIDIGTTTLAAVLVCLDSGSEEASAVMVNHQRAYGADVISRMQAANTGKGALLQETVRADLRGLMKRLRRERGVALRQVHTVVIAGNTAMCHLLLGFSCETLGVAPFTPVDISLIKKTYREVFGTAEYDAEVIFLPGISAFVGADIVSGIYGSRMAEEKKPSMLLDIGTNGEMVIGSRKGFLVTSAAAGPVFEGGNISCGMPGVLGAVTHITLRQENGGTEVICDTAAGGEPIGLCGTGIIDLTAELVRTGLVDKNGTLAGPWFEHGFPVKDGKIYFTQSDIREVQMGKAAIRAGVEILLREYDRAVRERQDGDAARRMPRIYLAGGFGFYMDVEKAAGIGLFPAEFRGQTETLGNSALAGAKRFLLEDERRATEEVQWIAAHAKEINLAMQPEFGDLYMKYMQFDMQQEDGTYGRFEQ